MNREPFNKLAADDESNIIAEAETKKFGDVTIVHDTDDSSFHGYIDGKCVQPNHDAKGVVRWLAHMLNNC